MGRKHARIGIDNMHMHLFNRKKPLPKFSDKFFIERAACMGN